MVFSRKKILFDGKECKLKFERYPRTNLVKLTLWYYDKETKQDLPLIEVTKDIFHNNLDVESDMVIKNYSENTGILGVLVAFKIVRKPHKTLHYREYPDTKFPVAKRLKI